MKTHHRGVVIHMFKIYPIHYPSGLLEMNKSLNCILRLAPIAHI